MNPIATAARRSQFPPMSEVNKTLKIDCYRCPIDRKVLVRLIVRDDTKALFQALGHLSLWLLTGSLCYYFYSVGMMLGFFVTLFIHGTIASFLAADHHELCHRTVFKTQWLNEFFLIIFSLLGWLNFRRDTLQIEPV